jgi:hypothetical protein
MSTYTVSAAPSNSTAALFQAWATAFGQGFTAMGWVPQTGHGELTDNYSGGTNVGNAYAWSFTPTLQTAAVRAIAGYTFRGAWSSLTTYTGGTTATSVSDVVTSGGQSWVAVANVSSGGSAPSAGASWQPFNFNIFKSNGSNSSSFPLYIKIIHGSSTTVTNMGIILSVGTGVDANGNLTGTLPMWGTNPIASREVFSNSIDATPREFDFCGDADNIAFYAFRGGSAAFNWVFVADRAKTSSGTDSDSFAYVAVNTISTAASGVLLNPAVGSFCSSSSTQWLGTLGFPAANYSNLGGTPAFPIFPIVGFLANPCLNVMGFSFNDMQDGAIIPVWIYGAVHKYLVMKTNTGGPVNGTSSALLPCIRWE